MTAAELWLELLTLLAVGVVIYFLRVGWRITVQGRLPAGRAMMLRTRFYTRMSQRGASFTRTSARAT